ncbi:MAG: DUF928 domain-containing protein, partial [Microcoleus sp. SIO2G3]|nr:DUF928 domain-containing protein [Microcoleus sp. SIO2G3]
CRSRRLLRLLRLLSNRLFSKMKHALSNTSQRTLSLHRPITSMERVDLLKGRRVEHVEIVCSTCWRLSPKPTEIAAQPEACALPGEDTPTLTVSEFPTLWFYVPAQEGQVSAELTLFDPQGQPLVRQQVALDQAGISGIRLTQPLEVDRSYTWRFRIDETPSEASMNPAVRGTVRRISLDPTLAAQLEAASAQEQIALYAANGIWQETLTALIQLRQTQPSAAVQADWSSLLDSVNLGSIADAPLLDCCASQPVAD